MCCFGNLVHGSIESEFVCFRGSCEAAQLSHELDGRRANLFIRSRRFEIVKRLDVSTHRRSLLEQRALPGLVIEDRTAVERARDCLLVSDDRVEVGLRFELSFNRSNEALQSAQPVELVLITELCGID